jgi:hypothetical protein
MLKLSSTGALAAIATTVPGVATPVEALGRTVPKWEIFEPSLKGPSTGNPFVEVELTAICAGRSDGHGRWILRRRGTV